MTDIDPQPPRPGFWERRILAKAQAEAIRIEARERAAAEAERVRANADVTRVTAAHMALVSAHEEKMRQLAEEKAAAERDAALAAAKPVATVDDNVLSAKDKGDRLWAIVLTIPLLSGTTAAMFGQIAALHPKFVPFVETELGVPADHVSAVAFAVAFAVGLTLETLGLFMARLAHKARLRGDSPMIYRTAMWTIVLFAAAVNYREWSPSWRDPTVLGVVFASLSIGSVLGWELREHRADRDRRAAEIAKLGWAATPIPPRPEFGAMRWLVAFDHTRTAWAVAVRERITDPNDALARADEILERRAVEMGTRAPRTGPAARVRFLVTGRLPGDRPARPLRPPAPPAQEDLSRWDVDVFADDLPGVPTLRLVDLPPEPEPPAQQPPAVPPARPAAQAVPPGRDQQQSVPPAREARVSPIEKAADPAEVKAGIRAYRAAHDAYPAPNWVKENLRVGPARAKKLLSEVQDEDAQEATG